jgi:ABC-type lipoprotein release transport system permease subunit
MSGPEGGEVVFVVDVTAFTKEGFVGTSTHGGERVEIAFDDEGKGVFLSSEMARRIGAKKGDPVVIVIEDKVHTLARTSLAALGRKLRISDQKAYYAVGRDGGAILRIRRP